MTDRAELELLDAYVDGRLEDGARTDFERRLVDRSDLRIELSRQQRIDEVLRSVVSPPSVEHLAAIARQAIDASAAPGRRRSGWLRGLAAAAGVAAALIGGWLIWDAVTPHAGPRGGYVHQPWRSLETVYRDWVAEGFKPGWVCKNDREFAESFRSVLGQGIVLGTLPAGSEAVGLSYCHSLTPATTCVLARVEGQPVVVFVDRLERDSAPQQPEGLNLFRRTLGGLVLYEMTPLEQPALLGAFNIGDGT